MAKYLLPMFPEHECYVEPFCGCCPRDACSRAVMLAKGMSEAANCTALGLLASLVCIGCHVVLTRHAAHLREVIDLELARFANALAPRAPFEVHGLRGDRLDATYREASR